MELQLLQSGDDENIFNVMSSSPVFYDHFIPSTVLDCFGFISHIIRYLNFQANCMATTQVGHVGVMKIMWEKCAGSFVG